MKQKEIDRVPLFDLICLSTEQSPQTLEKVSATIMSLLTTLEQALQNI